MQPLTKDKLREVMDGVKKATKTLKKVEVVTSENINSQPIYVSTNDPNYKKEDIIMASEEDIKKITEAVKEAVKPFAEGTEQIGKNLTEVREVIKELPNIIKSISTPPPSPEVKPKKEEKKEEPKVLTAEEVERILEEKEREKQRQEEIRRQEEERKKALARLEEIANKMDAGYGEIKNTLNNLVQFCQLNPDDPKCLVGNINKVITETLEKVKEKPKEEKEPEKKEVEIPAPEKMWKDMTEEERAELTKTLKEKIPHPALFEALKDCPECWPVLVKKAQTKGDIINTLTDEERLTLIQGLEKCDTEACRVIHKTLLEKSGGKFAIFEKDKRYWKPVDENIQVGPKI